MRATTHAKQDEPLIVVADARIQADGGRTLVEGLRLSLGREHVALVGRNGVGKSTLLSVLAGSTPHERVLRRGRTHLVPQVLDCVLGMSAGQVRRLRLMEARQSGADVLLLDEPTSDLDDDAALWLRAWLRSFTGGVVLASHDRRLLGDMEHFFCIRESGCRYFSGTLAELQREQAREQESGELRYLRNLHGLAVREEHTLHLARRKARKKQFGRSRELARCTSRARLNQKRSDAQVSHGKSALTRQARLDAVRSFAKSTRRALLVRLPLSLQASLHAGGEAAAPIVLRDVSAAVDGRVLFTHVDVVAGTRRIAVVGPNGAGKTTLLDIIMRRRAPTTGLVRTDASAMGEIAQGGTNWMTDEPLLSELSAHTPASSPEELAKLLVAHGFPLALAERPMRSLSPGERVRAALICLFVRSPPVDVLVLDEPTFSLDLLGQAALIQALRAWPRGLVVATHDRELLREVGFDQIVTLGGAGVVTVR